MFLVFFVGLIIKGIFDRKNAGKRLIAKLYSQWGKLPQGELTEEKIRSLQYYYKNRKLPTLPEEVIVDEITWNDLSLDYLFALLNATTSSMGEEYLWALLHEVKTAEESLAERERVISFFETEEAARLNIQTAFARIGKHKKTSIYEQIDRMDMVKRESNARHYAVLVCMAAGIALTPFYGAVGGGILCVCAVYNILSYYKRKAEISSCFTALSFIIRMLDNTAVLSAEHMKGLEPYLSQLRTKNNELKSLRRGAPVVEAQSVTGDMLSLILDYVRILFHTDLIRFNRMMQLFIAKKEDIIQIFETVGFLDTMCAVASFRAMTKEWCIPEFTKEMQLHAEGLAHPFLEEPVPADITAKHSVLVTGSNASGKSTFLKSVAINAILAQTVHTVCAKQYRASFFRIMSSMALSDNLFSGESYYIVEIRSLKRILEATGKELPVLCFVDEVLRGTNTVERIAASSRILASISEANAICFAATHDIELTYMLDAYYQNYHFEEQVKENRISFDYRLKSGRATSQNAIKLLKLMGYPETMIQNAEETAAFFLTSGEWRKIEK